MTNRTLIALVLFPLAACKCGGGLGGLNESLIAVPTFWDAGSIDVGQTLTGSIKLTDNGNYAVTFDTISATVQGDAGAGVFAAEQFTSAMDTLSAGASVPLNLKFKPNKVGLISDWINIQSDNGVLPIQVFGVGLDACAKVGCPSTNSACAGMCVEGACVYAPTTTACSDVSNCLSNGFCDGMGNCGGADDCVPSGSCLNATTVSGQIGTLANGHGTCSQGAAGQPGTCLFNTRSETCDCGCQSFGDGGGACIYSWAPDSTAPAGSYGSVWSSGSGDVWASAGATSVTGNYNAQTVYELTNGAWVQQATIAFGSNPLSGSGSGSSIALIGDGNGDEWGGFECAEMSGTNCVDAGMWKYSGGSASYEPFSPASFDLSCGTNLDIAQAYPVMLGTTAATLDADPCGPELLTENAGQFAVVPGSQIPTHCGGVGALWGTSLSDYYVGWGCGEPTGGIWHFDGMSYTKQTVFAGSDSASAMAGNGDSDIWAVGTQRWHYDGMSWTQNPGNTTGFPDTSLWAGVGGDYFASGTYPGVYHYTSASQAWTLECFAPGYQGEDTNAGQVAGDSSGNYYAATPIGIFKRQ